MTLHPVEGRHSGGWLDAQIRVLRLQRSVLRAVASSPDHEEPFADPRVARYWALLGVVNGWPPRPDGTAAHTWYAAALRASA